MEYTYFKMDIFQLPVVRIALFLAVKFPSVLSQCTTPVHLYAHHGTSETITSPNYPFNYPSSSDCQWLIQSESSSSTVGVVFSFINTESFFDKIRIYDSNTPGANLLVTIFGSTSNRYYESTGEYLYIRFTSDNGVEKSGFSLQYFSLFSTVIGQRQGLPCYALSNRHTITLSVTLSIQQTLSTFPDPYSGNDYCYWLVDTGAGNYLNISVLVTDDEYGTNPGGLTVYDGNSASATVLGTISDKSQTESGSVVLGTSQQYAFFVYHRQSISQYRGFLLSFNKVGSPPAQVAPPPTISPSVVNNTCGNELLSSDNITNYVTSPNYPFDYNSHSSCVWTIRATNESMIIQLTFEAIDLESCCDFLYVYDGETADYTLLGTITGNYYNSSGLPVYRSTGSAVRLHFVSDERTQQIGFKLGFLSMAPEIPSCVDQATTTILNASYSVQTFESHPEYSTSQNYNNSYEASWLIVKPKESDNLSLKLEVFNLEYSLNCVFDNVTFYKGACSSDPLAKTLCGSLGGGGHSYTYSTGKFLLVRFKTDISVADRGFSISYVLLNSLSSDDTSSSGLSDYVRYIIAGVFTAVFVIGALCLCVCCCRKLCPKTASLKSVAKSDMKRNLVLTNTNKPKTIKVPRKKEKRSKYGNKVTIDDPKFPLAGPGINPVAPPFPMDLKDKVAGGEKSADVPKTLPPIKEKKVKKPKSGKTDRVQSGGLSEDSSATILDHNSPIDFATIPPPFEYKDPWQLAKD